MDLNNITIIEPNSKEMAFMIGSTKSLTYNIKNNGEFKIKELELTVYTVKNRGEAENPDYVDTAKNYAKLVESPLILLPYETKNVKIKVEIPTDYNETITKDKRKRRVPFYIKFKVRGLEHIEEL